MPALAYFFWVSLWRKDPDFASEDISRLYCASFDGVTVGAPQVVWDGRLVNVPGVDPQAGDDYEFDAPTILFESGKFKVAIEVNPVTNDAATGDCYFEADPAGLPIASPAIVLLPPWGPPSPPDSYLTSPTKRASSEQGPIRFGSNLYILASGVFNDRPSVSKSTDDGATWVNFSVPFVLFSDSAQNYCIVPDLTRGFLHLLYRSNGSHNLCYRRFDMNTDTWGSEVDSGTSLLAHVDVAAAGLLSTGAVIIFYKSDLNACAYRFVAAQAFGPELDTGLPTATRPVSAVTVNGADVSRLIYCTADIGACNLSTVTLTAGGVLGTPQVIGPIFVDQGIGGRVIANVITWNDRFLCYVNRDGGTTDALAGFWMGTPIAAPVWTYFDLHDGLPQPGLAPGPDYGNGWLDRWGWVVAPGLSLDCGNPPDGTVGVPY